VPEPRNDLIFGDVLKALEAKRSPIVLTERKDHLQDVSRLRASRHQLATVYLINERMR
jgi:hypothetical protein